MEKKGGQIMVSVATVVGAFFLFLVVFPLVGMLAGICAQILVPYLFGGGLLYLLMGQLVAPSGAWWEYAIPLFAWAALVLGTRLMDARRPAWHEGHWHAVMVVVTFGLWRKTTTEAPLMDDLEYNSI